MNPLSDINVMIVDDSQAIRKIVRRLLENLGVANIREAEDSIEALERLKMAPSDIAIVDHDLGTFTGIDFIRMLRTARGSPAGNIGLILLTALKDEHLREEAMKAGADEFLTKPVSAENLQSCLLDVLKRRQETGEQADSTLYI